MQSNGLLNNNGTIGEDFVSRSIHRLIVRMILEVLKLDVKQLVTSYLYIQGSVDVKYMISPYLTRFVYRFIIRDLDTIMERLDVYDCKYLPYTTYLRCSKCTLLSSAL